MDPKVFALLALAAGVVTWVALARNRLAVLRGQLRDAFAQIDAQLGHRFDLVSSLVELARRYMEHERAALEAVLVARNLAVHATRRASACPGDLNAMQSLSQAAGMLSDSVGRLMVVASAYPELEADARMDELADELSNAEMRVDFARQAYNEAVTDYNEAISALPVSLVATVFGFAPSRQLGAAEVPAHRGAIRVQH